MRRYELKRTTKETDIGLMLELDGTGKSNVVSGVGFMDHMLDLLAAHGRLDLVLRCEGDTDVDDHHSVEDIGIALGEALRAALGKKEGINRYGSAMIPMDEALVLCALDLSGRAEVRWNVEIPAQKVGTFDTELCEEFFKALARSAGMTLHLRTLDGTNSHHIIEACFKAFARALRQAVRVDPELRGEIPSSKGSL
ncbi:MAG: imidazoleglycerol-phosphate dehydratase HisB [Oscillospiraceae bacterium]|nr:imidazoleglycerol-phosphate dehydratase HisB [Oscillospiraceae bacterium]